jgi:hypothetical protein
MGFNPGIHLLLGLFKGHTRSIANIINNYSVKLQIRHLYAVAVQFTWQIGLKAKPASAKPPMRCFVGLAVFGKG